ncbi:DUF2931 family protein [Desulfovibrio litoralis]|uniref:DUF2931 family protein n=1 Tax=Desulfovibrio litoralis DSM 11393 TaxID=1121455 RepID=A0A1M7TNS9_9BACT|nr:DUF2931 family protein [Desulfovibrio litoralis]SHN72404.1 Protein of unknown function [Desulfovibrio litoralis DSM 11393]
MSKDEILNQATEDASGVKSKQAIAPKKNSKFKRNTLIILVIICVFMAYNTLRPKPPMIYDLALVSQHYVWGERFTFDDFDGKGNRWGFGFGATSTGFGPPPSWGGGANLGLQPIPTQLYARWFDFPKQRFYEGNFDMPELPAKAAQVYKEISDRNPKLTYRNTLIIAVGAEGEVQLWLKAIADGTPNFKDPDWYNKKAPEPQLLFSGQADYGKGDPTEYTKRTAQARKAGEIPQETVPSEPIIKK